MSLALRTAPDASAGAEQALVAAVRGGDDRGFEELYSRYRKRIARYVLGMVGDHGRAEDITQEVFISALRRMRDTERPIAFKPWIYEIAKNACIDHARRVRPGREVPLGADDDEPALRPITSAASVERAVEAKQQLNDLRGAFGCLSDSHHQILVMRELEGLSYKQIGERMGMSRPVVESTLFRARRRLGEEYEELVSGRRCEHVQAVVADPDTRALGIRERRRLARHLAHCQLCRRHAHLAGFDDSVLKPTTLAGKIAALLPLPIVRLWDIWRPRGTPRGGDGLSRLQTSGMLRSAGTVTRIADPSGASIGFGRAAAAVAAIALAGAGGGVLVNGPGQSTAHRAPAPAAVGVAPLRHLAPRAARGPQHLRQRGGPPGPGGPARAKPGGTPAHGAVGGPPSPPPSSGQPPSSSPSGPPAGSGGSGSASAPTASTRGSAPASGATSAGGHSPASILPSLPVELPKPPAVVNVPTTAGSLPLPAAPKLPPLSTPPLPQLPQLPKVDLPPASPPASVPGAVGGLLPNGHG